MPRQAIHTGSVTRRCRWRKLRYQDVAATMNETIGRTVFSIVTVGTTPVLVAEPNSDGYKSNPASVELAIGSLDVGMTSHTYSVDQLLSVAESLLQPAA